MFWVVRQFGLSQSRHAEVLLSVDPFGFAAQLPSRFAVDHLGAAFVRAQGFFKMDIGHLCCQHAVDGKGHQASLDFQGSALETSL